MSDNRPKISVPVDLPGNAHKKPVHRPPSQTKEAEEKPKIKPVISGAVRKKESSLSKFTKSFFQEDVENVKEYVIFDVIIPEVKNTFLDVFEMMMFGEVRGRRTRNNRSGGIVNTHHTNYNKPSSRNRVSGERRVTNVSRRNNHDFSDIVVEERGDAEIVLDNMIDQIEAYGFVSVGDFYQFLDLEWQSTDLKYGWSNLGSARIERSRDGYRFKMPPTRVLD